VLTTVILDNILQLIERRTQYDRLSYSNSWATCFFLSSGISTIGWKFINFLSLYILSRWRFLVRIRSS